MRTRTVLLCMLSLGPPARLTPKNSAAQQRQDNLEKAAENQIAQMGPNSPKRCSSAQYDVSPGLQASLVHQHEQHGALDVAFWGVVTRVRPFSRKQRPKPLFSRCSSMLTARSRSTRGALAPIR